VADDTGLSRRVAGAADAIASEVLKAPIHVYRWTIRPWTGWRCRHLPTCSDYALEAIDTNGAWRGAWLTASRLLRCQPFGTSGYDPVPDTRAEHHGWRQWRHGRWRVRAVRGATRASGGDAPGG